MKGLLSNYKVIMERNKPYVAMIFIQFVYSGMALFSKAAISKGMNPYVFVVYRQAFASIALFPFAFFDRFFHTSFLLFYIVLYICSSKTPLFFNGN